MKADNQIFRHFRPLELTKRGELIPQRNGGISFLCLPFDERKYKFWLYICPMNMGFSSKAAVTALRTRAESAAPWGEFQLTDEPLIDQLLREACNSELPTEVGSMIKNIQLINQCQSAKFSWLKKQSALGVYDAAS